MSNKVIFDQIENYINDNELPVWTMADHQEYSENGVNYIKCSLSKNIDISITQRPITWSDKPLTIAIFICDDEYKVPYDTELYNIIFKIFLENFITPPSTSIINHFKNLEIIRNEL